jgi:hypothetical protein
MKRFRFSDFTPFAHARIPGRSGGPRISHKPSHGRGFLPPRDPSARYGTLPPAGGNPRHPLFGQGSQQATALAPRLGFSAPSTGSGGEIPARGQARARTREGGVRGWGSARKGGCVDASTSPAGHKGADPGSSDVHHRPPQSRDKLGVFSWVGRHSGYKIVMLSIG